MKTIGIIINLEKVKGANTKKGPVKFSGSHTMVTFKQFNITHLFLQWAKHTTQTLSRHGSLIDCSFLTKSIEEHFLHVYSGTLQLTLNGISFSLKEDIIITTVCLQVCTLKLYNVFCCGKCINR